MKTYEITVDEEIWNFLKSHAIPLEDTPNSVLRKFLLSKGGGAIHQKTTQHSDFPSFPVGVPKALSQILEVIYLIKKRGLTRTEATNKVADQRLTAPQTILDKYCRQLNKKAFEIDRLLEDKNLDEFRSLLETKFINHRDVIKDCFASLNIKH
ncbi:MAG: hypothetical protein Q7U10_02720 [Thermodesulfovibrionia bacterium]|nr:hypothetical protein [Thermodesulfovibrionia bacterium]